MKKKKDTGKGDEIWFFKLNQGLKKSGGVKIGTVRELRGQHISAASEDSGSEMHISDLKDLESAVVAEPERKMGPFLEPNRAVVEAQIGVENVEDGVDEGEIDYRVFPFHG